jgi:hypothetical protein
MNNPTDRFLRGRADGCFVVIDAPGGVPGGIMAPLFPAVAIRGGEALDGARATSCGSIAATQHNGGHLG